MDILGQIQLKAKQLRKRIVFPESFDPRVQQAIEQLNQSELVIPVVIDTYLRTAYTEQLSLSYYESRKSKGITHSEAKQEVENNPLLFGALLVKEGIADGAVAGSIATTADTVRAAIRGIGLAPSLRTLSSFFLMVFPDTQLGCHGTFIYADCGVVPDPTSSQLADIAIAAYESAGLFLTCSPMVALLSYSTKGSADGDSPKKVREAVQEIRQRRPNLPLDGELQADAALIPEIGNRKAPSSPIAGKANTLIFPNLDAGNIAYKISERLGRAKAIGPILQGLNKPMNDLSRGCSVEDIINTACITAIQSTADLKG